MSPIDWAKRPITKYADFSGRAPRAEYWWFYLGMIVAYLVAVIIDSLVGMQLFGPYGLVTCLLAVGLLVPSLAVSIRRLHDTNRSGWWLLIVAIPYAIVGFMMGRAASSGDVTSGMATAGIFSLIALAGAVVLFIFLVLPGTKGGNGYGPDPYAGDAAAA